MKRPITIYSSSTPLGHVVRFGTGSYQGAAMWNTITNLLRIVNAVFECYYCAMGDGTDGFYETADGELYQVMR